MITSKDIKKYREEHGVSLMDASKALHRKKLTKELRSDRTVSDLADTLLRILNFEFNGYKG